MESTKNLIESDTSIEEAVNKITVNEAPSVGDPVRAMEGDTIVTKDGKEYQLFSHSWFSDTREPIAISTGLENVEVTDGNKEFKIPITKLKAVSVHPENKMRDVKWVDDRYGESELIYTS